jgi:hypothetical protein
MAFFLLGLLNVLPKTYQKPRHAVKSKRYVFGKLEMSLYIYVAWPAFSRHSRMDIPKRDLNVRFAFAKSELGGDGPRETIVKRAFPPNPPQLFQQTATCAPPAPRFSSSTGIKRHQATLHAKHIPHHTSIKTSTAIPFDTAAGLAALSKHGIGVIWWCVSPAVC